MTKTSKVIFIFILFSIFSIVPIFSQSEFRDTVIINNDKLYIAHVFMNEDFYGNRSFFRRWDYIDIKNKTNFEMEVQISYTIIIYDMDRHKETRRERINNEKVFLGTQAKKHITPNLPYNRYIIGIIEDIQLIYFKVNEKNYERPW